MMCPGSSFSQRLPLSLTQVGIKALLSRRDLGLLCRGGALQKGGGVKLDFVESFGCVGMFGCTWMGSWPQPLARWGVHQMMRGGFSWDVAGRGRRGTGIQAVRGERGEAV